MGIMAIKYLVTRIDTEEIQQQAVSDSLCKLYKELAEDLGLRQEQKEGKITNIQLLSVAKKLKG